MKIRFRCLSVSLCPVMMISVVLNGKKKQTNSRLRDGKTKPKIDKKYRNTVKGLRKLLCAYFVVHFNIVACLMVFQYFVFVFFLLEICKPTRATQHYYHNMKKNSITREICIVCFSIVFVCVCLCVNVFVYIQILVLYENLFFAYSSKWYIIHISSDCNIPHRYYFCCCR